MHTYDPQKAARVWQRVQGREEEPRPAPGHDLQGLILNALQLSAVYLKLARQMPPKAASVLQQLYREEQNHLACLKGIHTLMTGQRPVLHMPRVENEPAERLLRRCYGMEMRSLKEYEAGTADPEYGHVFARLADQEREHCRRVLALVGSLEKQGGNK